MEHLELVISGLLVGVATFAVLARVVGVPYIRSCSSWAESRSGSSRGFRTSSCHQSSYGRLSRRTVQKALVLLHGIFKRAKRRK